ncbi:MAG: hypothetical protein KDA85_14430, partial [Planctomycetaceae bacterium]|nr:hypothetical protein [Planctomycetaceae bacterium]
HTPRSPIPLFLASGGCGEQWLSTHRHIASGSESKRFPSLNYCAALLDCDSALSFGQRRR